MLSSFKKIPGQTGFSLLEVVIAMGLITMTMMGVSSLVLQNLQVRNVNKNYLIASMLAQEGIELVRNERDKNWRTPGNNWYDNINQNDYRVDYFNGIVDDVSDSGGDDIIVGDTSAANALLQSDGNGFYQHSAGTPTIFYRMIKVYPSPVSGPPYDYIRVKALVQWPEKNKISNYIAETYLYDWR